MSGKTNPSAKPPGWGPVYRVVRRIPTGKVASYGQVAALAGMPRAARQVGWALSALTGDDDVPWHRVINAKGEVSPRGAREFGDLQRALLEAEGVAFDRHGRVDLASHAWTPGARASAAAPAKRKTKRRTERKIGSKTARGPARRKRVARKTSTKTANKTANKRKAT